MNDIQILTIKCAYADLRGAYQAYKSLDIHSHDWESHLLTIEEMERDFPFLTPIAKQEDQNILLGSCSCGEKHEPDLNQFIAFNENGNPVRNTNASIELYYTHEEAILNTTGDKKPIRIIDADLEIQTEIKTEHMKNTKHNE